MKKKYLRKFLMVAKFSMYGFLLQTMLFTALFAFNSNAQVRSVKEVNVSIQLRQAGIEQAIGLIEKQTNFVFVYSPAEFEGTPLIDINVRNKPVADVLMQISRQFRVKFKQVNNNISVQKLGLEDEIVPVEVIIQTRTITGRVVSQEDGEPLPGVNILIKGTNSGTISSFDGTYALEIPTGQTVLVFSFVGYLTQEVEVNERSIVDVVLLSDIQALDEIVVVGYGEQKKVNMTGAVSAVNFDERITSRSLSNVSSSLAGLLPGLSVSQNSGMAGNNEASLLIRGMGTVNNANPLIVVDGMPDVDINRLNMNDIESISVLKDASSSAVYGSRAANGVILITTKTGRGQGKAKINISSTYSIDHPVKALSYMADYPRDLTLNQFEALNTTLRANVPFKDGTIDQWMAMGMIDPIRFPNTDWWDIVVRDGHTSNHNVSATGSNENINYYVSAGVMDQKGMQIMNDFTRYNARFSFDTRIRPNMNVGARFSGNWSNFVFANEEGFTRSSSPDTHYAPAGMTPYDPSIDRYGEPMAYNADPTARNLLVEFTRGNSHQNRQEVNPMAYWDWKPIKGLTARVDYALNYFNQFRWSASMPTRGWNFQKDAWGGRTWISDNAGVSNTTNAGYKTQLTGRLNYELELGRNHELNTMLVYSEEYWYERRQGSSRTDRIHPILHEIDAALQDNPSASGGSSTEGLRSYIGRVNYIAFDKYLLEANFRYDGSSKFLYPHQYSIFPSASIGWIFSRENFMANVSDQLLTTGKFRMSYGGLGNNSGVGRYEQQETLTSTPYVWGGNIVRGFVNQKMVNLDLTWESTYVFNFGIDLGFLRNRLTTEIDFYDRKTINMLRPSEMSIFLTGAYSAPRRNIGEMRNRGMEINLTWRDRIGELRYSVNLLAAHNQNRLEKWNEYLGRGTTFINMPLNFLYNYEDIGIAQSWFDIYNATPQNIQPGDVIRLDLNGDGRIDGNDRKAYPQYNTRRPPTDFGLNSHLAWKGIDMSILLQGTSGRRAYWLTQYNRLSFAGTRRYATSWDHWTLPWSWENRDGAWPRLGASNSENNQTFWLDDMSFIRLKNLQLGYTVPNKGLNRIGIENIRIYGTAENLLTFTQWRGLDPEKELSETHAYPLVKSFSFGINLGI